ncbi:transcriptional regulator [Xanthomonas oryzae pv. oryzae]|uniref:DNA-binding winged-HTH domains n=3 Tax=Xanthomonas oryzae TaxID=347 RepID=Q5H6Z0_XANOR|nr:DNA-binding winged-HTH domains [Xanthomonas oryzae pv. oryzae KACC 10331]AJQ81243.1 transcriptional regulator [Xanthomonas oryzae pv. oryzae PXO86]ALZ70162.1 transcriptional regulator [Xanthomonas oryzae pv. oryzae]BAE66780.1 hypotethical protein [Xanthomonas oryzae pv. oryzae MAFF 311018]AOS00702.1 transcriptional regulator [Xanthomonas oryzae pv. oryzae]
MRAQLRTATATDLRSGELCCFSAPPCRAWSHLLAIVEAPSSCAAGISAMSLRRERVTQLGSVSRFRLGRLLVEPERLTLIDDGQTIALEPRMMEVLIALAERPGEVVSAEQC